jgi:hypothetical protein
MSSAALGTGQNAVRPLAKAAASGRGPIAYRSSRAAILALSAPEQREQHNDDRIGIPTGRLTHTLGTVPQ